MKDKTTASHAAKAYPPKHGTSTTKQAIIISHHAPFKPASKKKVDEISARLSQSNTFSSKMRGTDAPDESARDICPKRDNQQEDKDKQEAPSPRPPKSLLKKPLRTQPLGNQGQNPNGQRPANKGSSNGKATNAKVSNNKPNSQEKNVRFNSASSRKSQTTAKSNSKAKKPGAFLRMLLDGDDS